MKTPRAIHRAFAAFTGLALGMCGCGWSPFGLSPREARDNGAYTVLASHSSYWGAKAGVYQPASYEIRHGDNVIQAECLTLTRAETSAVTSCQNSPDPTVPVNIPLQMTRNDADHTLNWKDASHPGDEVSFKIVSEQVVKVETAPATSAEPPKK